MHPLPVPGRDTAEFRFYAELNDFLPPALRSAAFLWPINGRPAVKDPIEAIGVPHPEVELIVVGGVAVGFDYRIHRGARVAVYPSFSCLDIGALPSLRPAPPSPAVFVCDVHLGKLARLLRLFGFDTLYRNDYADPEIVELASAGRRIVLTRDRRLLCARAVVHGYWLRSDRPERQLEEVLRRYALYRWVRPWTRCMACNGPIAPVQKAEIDALLLPKTRRYYDVFHRCTACGKVYWEGPHVAQLRRRFAGRLWPPGSCGAG